MARPIHLPSSNFDKRRLPSALLRSSDWWKVHATSRSPTQFSTNPGHRFSPPDACFEVLYLGADITTCLWEVFGDEVLGGAGALSLSAWTNRSASVVRIPECRVCNLNTTATRTALGCDLTALFHNEFSIPQSWAEAIHDHPAKCDGLLYMSRFTKKRCVALFAPPLDPNALIADSPLLLTDQPEALRFLADNRLALV